MIELLQPILIALTVLVIPASARLAFTAMSRKLDEGREIASQNKEDLKRTTANEAAKVASLLAEHRAELMTEIHAIKEQTTATNGKLARHDKDITRLAAETELLTKLFIQRRDA